LDWLSPVATIFWLVGCANAFNLIDGLDGLAAGVGLFATFTVLIAAMLSGDMELALIATPLAGALLAFLRYNFNPASIFLGDSGSLTIGFLLGCYGVIWGQKSATLLGLSAPVMAMAIPLLDASLSIVRRFLRHQPIFGGDRGHIHHRLLDKGITPQASAIIIYLFCCVGAILSLLQNFLAHQYGGVILVLFAATVWIGVQNLGYVELGLARQLFLKGSFRRIIDGQTRLHSLAAAIESAHSVEECWPILKSRHREFGFERIRMNVHGRLFETDAPAIEIDESPFACWQLRVPLPDGHYVNFWRDLDVDPTKNHAATADFIRVVQAQLSSKIVNERRRQVKEISASSVWMKGAKVG
jgi:UDP-GlcNAc:undecaprenyl-phosphate GlcNAc-1-phosphate transferase